MIRESAIGLVLGLALASTAAGQQSIGVSATILERVEADAVELQVRSFGDRLSVTSVQPRATAGTRLLRATYVSAGIAAGSDASTSPVYVQDGSSARLERRAVRSGRMTGDEVEAGEALYIDAAEQLTVTRVIASNS